MFLLNLPLAALLVSVVIAIPSTYVADKRAATDNVRVETLVPPGPRPDTYSCRILAPRSCISRIRASFA